jgi:polyisoprenoid-binding protein YceI
VAKLNRGKDLLVFSLSLLISACPLLASERPIDLARSGITVRVWFRVDTAKMTVLPEKDQEAVQSTMQKSVLESAKFPEIRFESTSTRKVGEDKWTGIGNLTLHGETRPITIDVHNDGSAYVGESRI